MSNRKRNPDASASFYLGLAAAGAIAYFVMRSRTPKPTDTASRGSEQNNGGMYDSQSLDAAYADYRESVASPNIISASFGGDYPISELTEIPYDRALQIQKNLRNFTIPDVHEYLPLDGIYTYETDFYFKCFVYWCLLAFQNKLDNQYPSNTLDYSYQLLGENGIFGGSSMDCALNYQVDSSNNSVYPWRIIYNCDPSNGRKFKMGDTMITVLRSAYEYLSTKDVAEFNCNPSPKSYEMPWNSDTPSDGCNYTVGDRAYMQASCDDYFKQYGFIA